MTRTSKPWLVAILAIPLAAPLCEPNRVQVTPVQMRDSDGTTTSSITDAQVQDWVDFTNDTWIWEFVVRPGGMQQLDSTILNTQPSTDAEDLLYQQVGNFAAAVLYTDGVPVYFRARGGGGFSWGPTGSLFVSMPAWNNTGISKPSPGSPNETLLSHEIGHYFGLPHTFGGAGCGSVTPTNADGDVGGQVSGAWDDITDTAADPGAACAPTTSLSCNESATVALNGSTFSPPWTNLMTYHDCLPESMSGRQIVVVGEVLQDPKRNNVLVQ